MNTPAYSDNRTDAEIRADSEKDKGLEAGTMRDANGVPRNMRHFPPAPVETYAQYVARVSGLVDIQILTEAQWRKETGQKTAEETILADLGIAPRPIVEVKVPLDTPVLDGTEEGTWVAQELDISDYFSFLPTVSVVQELKTSLDKAMQGIEDLINTPAAEAEARHTAAHLPAVDSIKLEL